MCSKRLVNDQILVRILIRRAHGQEVERCRDEELDYRDSGAYAFEE